MSWKSEIVAELKEHQAKARKLESEANVLLSMQQRRPEHKERLKADYILAVRAADSEWKRVGILESML